MRIGIVGLVILARIELL